jgi:hypothetical protein
VADCDPHDQHGPAFTPKGYRDAMAIKGKQTIVRQADGIHLNNAARTCWPTSSSPS